MDKAKKRKADIEYWWEGAESLVELVPQEYTRLRLALSRVLEMLPEADFAKFREECPHIICNANQGRVFSYSVPVPRNVPVDRLLQLNVIYLDPTITNNKTLVHRVAHEIAHIVRGDHRKHGDRDVEKRADDLSEKWGFKRCYSQKMLRRLKED